MADENKNQPQPAKLPVNPPPGGAQPNQGDPNAVRRTEEASRARAEDNRRASAENIERARAERAERPQGVGGNPTPTQEENDEIRAGVRHIDDKKDDGSGPDYGVKRDEAMRAAFNRGENRDLAQKDYKTR